MELIVFLKNGETLKFSNVSNVRFSTNFFTVLCFDYVSASNHKKEKCCIQLCTASRSILRGGLDGC